MKHGLNNPTLFDFSSHEHLWTFVYMVISSNFHITRLDYLHSVGCFSSSHCEGKSKKVGNFPWLRWMTWLLVIYRISQFYPIYIYVYVYIYILHEIQNINWKTAVLTAIWGWFPRIPTIMPVMSRSESMIKFVQLITMISHYATILIR